MQARHAMALRDCCSHHLNLFGELHGGAVVNLGAGASVSQHLRVDQGTGIDDDIGSRDEADRLERDQLGIARPCADKMDHRGKVTARVRLNGVN